MHITSNPPLFEMMQSDIEKFKKLQKSRTDKIICKFDKYEEKFYIGMTKRKIEERIKEEIRN